MTLLLTRSRSSSRAIREQVGPNLPTSFGSSFSAVVGMPMFGRSLVTEARILAAEEGPVLAKKAPPGEIGLRRVEEPFEGRIIPVRELNDLYSDIGLTFDRDTGADAVQILVDRKRAENIRNSIVARAPQDILSLGGRFGAALIASAIDPLELASIFIPFVGAGRAAGLIARHGKVLGRAAVGFREGLGGSLLIEPGFFLISRQLQDDYTFTDALVNVFTGAVLGGGIGAAIGGVSRVRAGAREKVQVRKAAEFVREVEELEVTRGLERQGILDDITLKKADVKRLKKESKARTRELDAIRKAGTGEEPKVALVRKRLAAERTEIDARKAVVAKELRVLQKKVKDEFPAAEPIDTKVALDGLRAAVAQVVQGKSVKVGAVVNPARRALAEAIEEKVADIKRFERDEIARAGKIEELEAKSLRTADEELDADITQIDNLTNEIVFIREERLATQREVATLKKQATELDIETAADVAKSEASPSRSSMADKEAEARITEGAAEKELDAEAIEKGNEELSRVVDQIEDLTPEDKAVLKEIEVISEKATAAEQIIKDVSRCMRR